MQGRAALLALAGLLAAIFTAGCAAPDTTPSATETPSGERASSPSAAVAGSPAQRGKSVASTTSALAETAPAMTATPEQALSSPDRPDNTASAVAFSPASRGLTKPRELERGGASWYGLQFHGRRTASGEPYNMYQLTAAHRTLPFGTIVRVRSAVNGREVNVRINDRGPFARGRVIDLSRAAADELDMRNIGVKDVVLLLPTDGSSLADSANDVGSSLTVGPLDER